MQGFLNAVTGIANESGFVGIMENPGYLIMIIVACGLIYLAIGKQFEPLLLLPIAFGMLLANLPFGEIIHMQYFIPPEGADLRCIRCSTRSCTMAGWLICCILASSWAFIRR